LHLIYLTVPKIQRFGRTGRKREGVIHALLAEGREEGNIDKAEATYKEVQNVVNRGETYELYGDVERLLPDHIVPQCVEKVVEIQEYVRPEGRQKAPPKNGTQGTKRKRNDDVARNIPDGASTGFVSVRELVVKGAKKQKKKAILPKDFDTLGDNDETDDDIESGRVVAAPRRTQSATAAQSSEKKGQKGKLKKSATIATNKAPKKRKKKTKEYSASQLSQLAADDSDDLDIEAGVVVPSLRSQLEASRASAKAMSPMFTPEPSPPERLKKRIDDSVIELSDSDRGQLSSQREDMHDSPAFDPPTLDPTSYNGSPQAEQNMSWLVDDDDDDNRYDFKIVDSSPLAPKRPPPIVFERVQLGDESMEISNPMLYDNDVVPTSDPFEPMLEDSLEIIGPPLPMKEKNQAASQHVLFSPFRPASILLSPSRNKNAPGTSRFRPAGTPKTIPSPAWDRSSKTSMLPPALPQRFLASTEDSPGLEMPEASFPVRPLQNQAKRRRIIYDEPESPSTAVDLDTDMMPPPSSQHRLHRMESTPTREKTAKNKKRPRAKPSLLARNVNPLLDGEAAHSGDEVSEGYSEEDEESEWDRQFIKNSPATQVSQSYDQSLIYRQSLLTQMPAAGPAPSFGGRVPVRARPFGRIDGPRQGGLFLPSSSPPPPDDELDNYHLGSFVVDDDEEISYEL
jgi:ATP-dependent DNA helicase MPH1